QLQGGGGGQDVGVGVAVPVLERAFHVLALGAGELAGVFCGGDPEGVGLTVQAPVVVAAKTGGLIGLQGTGAARAGAAGVAPIVLVVQGHGLAPVAHRAAQSGPGHLVGADTGDADVAGGEPVGAGGVVVGGKARDDALVVQQFQEPAQVAGGGVGGHAQAAAGPVLVPGALAGDGVEFTAGLGPVQQEAGRGHRDAAVGLGEGRHALGALAPDGAVTLGAGVGDPLVQPPVPNPAPGADTIQQPAHVASEHLGFGQAGERLGAVLEQVAGEPGDPVGVVEPNVGGGGAGEFD